MCVYIYFVFSSAVHPPRVNLSVLPKGCANGEEGGGSFCLPRKLGNIAFAKLRLGKYLAGCM